MKHTVEVTTRNSYGGRKFVATVELDAPSAEVALDQVLDGEGLGTVTLDADTSYTLKCGDALASSFGDEFEHTAAGTRPKDAPEPLTPGKLPWTDIGEGELSIDGGPPVKGRVKMRELTEEEREKAATTIANNVRAPGKTDGMIARAARLMDITPEQLEEAIEQGMSLDTTEMGGQLIDARLIEPCLDSGDLDLIGDEIQIDIKTKDKATPALKDMPRWDFLRRSIEAGQINIPIPAEVQPGTPKGFATGGIVKGPAPMFPHIPPPIYMPKPEPSDGREELRDLLAEHSLRESRRRVQMAQGAAIEFRNNPQWNTCMVGGYTWKLSRIETGAYGSNSITPTVVYLDLISTGEPGSIGMMSANYRIQLKP